VCVVVAGSGWTKIVALRDPLERIVSGYLDWCVDGHGKRDHCSNFEDGAANPSFEEFALALAAKPSTDLHFMPQSTFCGLKHPGVNWTDDDLVVLNISAGALPFHHNSAATATANCRCRYHCQPHV